MTGKSVASQDAGAGQSVRTRPATSAGETGFEGLRHDQAHQLMTPGRHQRTVIA
jgi:hypothetical protein